ncbi:MAG: STAS domain-containing protein [Deltaproteobacteria bacterium]|jgi:rsbT antagonist protein RsbS
MDRIPILRVGDILLVSVQIDMHDELALRLQDDLLHQIEKTSCQGVLIDIAGLDVVDSFAGRLLGDLAKMSRILGAQTVLVGVKPEVAMTLVELGVTLDGIHTALNVDRGMEKLRSLCAT